MKMAHAVQTLAERTPGKEAQAIEAFARALRQVFPTLFASLMHFSCCFCGRFPPFLLIMGATTALRSLLSFELITQRGRPTSA